MKFFIDTAKAEDIKKGKRHGSYLRSNNKIHP